MPSWRTQGVRPLRSLFPGSAYVCPPCRLRLFSTITSRSLRHSTRLLDAEASHDNTKTVTVESVATDHATQAPSDDHVQDMSPSNKEDLSVSEKSKDLETPADKHEAEEKDEQSEHSKESEADTPSSQDAASNLFRKIVPSRGRRPRSSDAHNKVPSFMSLMQSATESSKTDLTPKSILDFFKSSDEPGDSSPSTYSSPSIPSSSPSSSSSSYDGGAIQSLRDAMLSLKNDPLPVPRMTARRLRTRRRRFVNSPAPLTPERILKAEKKREADERRATKHFSQGIKTMDASSIKMQRLEVDQPRVPRLQHGLDRVLFNQGVHQLQDRRSKVYNFDPYLQKIMPVTEFDYDALSAYKTSSQDKFLSEFAKKHDKKYVGSTSSMTSTLSHFHYLLSAWRKIDTSMFSRDFPDTLQSFTALNRTPTFMFLRRKGDTYAIDADKEFDGANILMLLGRSMEKLMTLPTAEFERYRKGKSGGISEVERNQPESYHYSSLGDFLLRSQLDAQDDRLPGTGMFDLKTRAVLPIRMRSNDHEPMTGYEIRQAQGQYESFEREYYDMMRGTALKYSLQARMGHMDGIFVAYHNVKRIFGFQYISMSELDRALHGTPDTTLGNQEFNLSISLLNEILNKATEKFPDQSLRFSFETKAAEALPSMHIYAEPMSEEDIDAIQNSQKEKIAEWERKLRDPTYKSNEQPVDDSVQEDDNSINEFEDSSSDLVKESSRTEVSESDQISNSPEAESEASVAQNSEATEKDPLVEQIEGISETSDSKAEAKSEADENTDKPLLGLVLTVRSKVDGEYVERPERLKKNQDWTIEYSLTEKSTPQAWREYTGAKNRRKSIYGKLNSNLDKTALDKADSESTELSYNDHYINMLKDLSEKGRKIRAGLDEKAANQPKIVVGMPYVKPEKSQTANTDDVSIECVDDYLTWLYNEKTSPAEGT